jgi:hypothetical protein
VSIRVYQQGYDTTSDYIDVNEKTPYGVVDPVMEDNEFI